MTKADRLRQLEIFLCIGLAIALNISLTVSWVFLIAGVVVTLLRPNLSARFKMVIDAPMTLPLVVFALALTISVLANGGTRDIGQIFTNLRSFVAYFYIYQAFAGGDGIEKKAIAVILGTAALAGIYGTVQQLFNFHPFTYQWLQATGFLAAPMPFAGLMQLTSFLGLGILLKKGYLQLPGIFANQRVFLAVVIANLLGLFFACERSAWLGMLVGLMAITLRSSPKLFFKAALAGAVLLALAWFCVPAVQARLVPLLTDPQSDISVRTRVKLWNVAKEQYFTHPLVGIGPSHFPRVVIPEALVPGGSPYFDHAHSNYFHILATMGSLGFLAFMSLIVFSLRLAIKQSRESDLSGGIGLGLFASLVSLMVAGLFEYNFGAGQVKLAEWFLLGALRPKEDKQTESTKEG